MDQGAEDVTSLKFSLLDDVPGVIHGISTRKGGVSTGPYQSLNLGFAADDPACVLENRRRFCDRIGTDASSLVLGFQCHGFHVAVASEGDRGRGALDSAGALPETDGIVTSCSGTPVMVLGADCPLVLIAARRGRAVAAVHSGRKGSIAGIAGDAVRAMSEQLGVAPRDLVAGIGPGIGVCCYEIGPEVVDEVQAKVGDTEGILEMRGGSHYMNIVEKIRRDLIRAGLPAEQIEIADRCTCCEPEHFFSYRRDGACTGRIGAVIALTE